MTKGRLEAFSDGVIAIIITIMVLEFRIPHEATWHALLPIWHELLGYVLSFAYVGIYWNNHHHVFHSVERVGGMALWGNLHLLFWLSLIPFASGWVGESDFAKAPMALYGIILFMCAIAWEVLLRLLMRHHGKDSTLARVRRKTWKENFSILAYLAGIGLSLVNPWIGFACYVLVAAIWFVPDRRVELAMHGGEA